MKSLTFALIVAAMLGAPFAHAHDDATLDKTKAPNGGQLRAAGIYHFELVVVPAGKEAKESPVKVYVTDHAGTKIPTAGATGTGTLLSGGVKTTIALQPQGENLMVGRGVYLASPDLKAIVSITLAGKAAEQARFTPFALDAGMKH